MAYSTRKSLEFRLDWKQSTRGPLITVQMLSSPESSVFFVDSTTVQYWIQELCVQINPICSMLLHNCNIMLATATQLGQYENRQTLPFVENDSRVLKLKYC